MPDETEGGPDELERLLSDSGEQEPELDSATPGQNDKIAASTHGTPENQHKPSSRLFAGRYKSPEDLEKAHLDLRKGLDERSSRIKTLEALLKDPVVRARAANDPNLSKALVKAGYELAAEQEAQREEEQGGEWNGDENDPRFQMQLMREEVRLFKEEWSFTQKFMKDTGRDPTPQELNAIKQKIHLVPDLSYEEAWQLTPHYRKMVEEGHKKALEEAGRKAAPKGPRGQLPQRLPGQKLDLKKDVREMNEQERVAKLTEIIDRTS